VKSNFLVVAALVLSAQASFGYSINEARSCLFEGQTSVCKGNDEMLSSILPKWKVLISKDETLATTGEAARTVSALVEAIDTKSSSTPTSSSLEISGKKILVKVQISEEDMQSANPLCQDDSCVLVPAAQKLEFISLKSGKVVAKTVVTQKQAAVAVAPDAGLVLMFETLMPDTSNAGRYSVINAATGKVLFHKVGVDGAITKDGRYVTIVNRISESSEKNRSTIYDMKNGFKKAAVLKTSSVGALKTSYAMGVFCRTSQAAATECVVLK
jgi:hypothetical protein